MTISSQNLKRSVTGQQWLPRIQTAEQERQVAVLVQQQELPEPLARVLVGRDITPETSHDFLHPSLRASLPDPSHLKDMDKAASRIADAIQAGEQCAVFGDYDVDGATSTALLKRYFAMCSREIRMYIPDRQKEGYGPNVEALSTLADEGATLILSVDCGTVALEVFNRFNLSHGERSKSLNVVKAISGEGELQVETPSPVSASPRRPRPVGEVKEVPSIIILDHHQGEAELPPVHAVVNPNRLDEDSDQGHLAAVGVTFLTLVAVNRELRQRGFFAQHNEPNLLALLDLVALGTVCDVVPLKGLNRAFVTQGLDIMRQRYNAGLRVLCDVARIDEPLSAYHCGFILGPRINAGGRVGEAHLGSQLLSAQSDEGLQPFAEKLDRYNKDRQAIETQVLEAAMAQAETKANKPVIIVGGEGWHPGVIGIVAGRLKERYERPTAVIAWAGDEGKASARSVDGADIGTAVTAAKQEGLLTAGGGHSMAAGFSIMRDQFNAFEAFICERLEKAVSDYEAGRHLKLDGWLAAGGATLELAQQLERAGPFGMGNASPKLALQNVKIVKFDVLKEQHIRVILADAAQGTNKGRGITAMAFRSIDTPIGEALLSAGHAPFSVAGQLKINRWQGTERAQFIIDDVML